MVKGLEIVEALQALKKRIQFYSKDLNIYESVFVTPFSRPPALILGLNPHRALISRALLERPWSSLGRNRRSWKSERQGKARQFSGCQWRF
jgi:hypothetical protein